MFKLKIISGPQAGESYELKEGSVTIGRQADNVIRLDSARVSKRHCVLTVNGGVIEIEDQGSSNGTFVNGVLTDSRPVQPGDRISVGESVIEIRESSRARRTSQSIQMDPNVIPFRVEGTASAPSPTSQLSSPNQAPADAKGKLNWFFERFIMPAFYGMNLKYDWRTICQFVLTAFVLLTLLISVYPLLQSSRISLIKETGKRAKFMARQIAQSNAAALAQGLETKTSIGITDSEQSVRFAVLVDLDNRILAPGDKMNSYLAAGDEADLAVRAAQAFREGREVGVIKEVNDSTLVAIEPVKVYNPKKSQNDVVAMSVVAIDTTLSTPDIGSIAVVYSNAFVITFLVGAFLFFILYRLTLKRFELLNEDIDKVLRGEGIRLTRDFKFSELNELWDVIDAALKRIPKTGMEGGLDSFSENRGSEEYIDSVGMIGEVADFGLIACDQDKKVIYMNSVFEEISGIRPDMAIGQEIFSVVRDEAFGSLCEDMFRLAGENNGVPAVEDFDFGGINYRIRVSLIGADSAKGYLLVAVREGE